MIAHIRTVGLITCDNLFGKFIVTPVRRHANQNKKNSNTLMLTHQQANSFIMTIATLPTMGEVLDFCPLVFTKASPKKIVGFAFGSVFKSVIYFIVSY